jgi:hypothetical protein
LLELVYRLRDFNKKQPLAVFDFKTAHELAEQDTASQLPEFESYEEASDKAYAQLVEIPEVWLDTFPPITKHAYLHKRGILPWVASELGLRFDPKRRRICFPVRDRFGRLVGMQGRDITETNALRYYAYPYKGRTNKNIWLGEDKVDWDTPVVLTEGPFDYASIYRVYPNVLASLGGLNFTKLKRIGDASRLITFFDYGTGGNTARKRTEDVYGPRILQHVQVSKEIGDAGNYPLEALEALFDSLFDKTYKVV